MKKRKILSIFLALAMVLSLLPVSALAEEPAFTDIEGHWGESAIERWSDYGVVSGKGGGIFDPDANMTRAEMAQMYVNLLNLTEKADISKFTDVPADAWYADAVAKCVAAGILNGTSATTISPNGTVTREQMFVTFGRAMGLTPVESTDSQLSDLDDVSDWAEGMVNALLEAGYISGMGDNTLQPGADINRASVMALLDKSVAVYANESGATVTGNGDNGLVLVVADDVTITGTVGDVIVAQGAAEGTVTLENATVTGTVTVNAPAARVSVAGETTVENLVVAEDAQGAQVSVEKDAAVASVSTAAEDTTLAVSGKVESVTVTETAGSATVNAQQGAQIDSVTTAGADTTVSGSGTVNKVEAAEGSTGATVTTPGTTVENNGSGSVTTDKGEVKPGETGTTAPSGGSSSGGSTGGGSSTPSYTFADLQAAIEAAEPGATVTLRGNVTVPAGPENNLVLDEAITINGNGYTITRSFDNVSVDDGYGNYEAVFTIAAAGVTIQNVKFAQDSSTAAMKDEGFIYVSGNGAEGTPITISGCEFTGKGEMSGLTGIITSYGAGAYVQVNNNTFTNLKYAVYCNAISNGAITGNTVTTTDYTGIYMEGSDNTITGNTLTNIAAQNYDSVLFASGIYVTGSGNTIADNSVTLAVGNANGVPVGGNVAAEVNGAYYPTLPAAISDAASGDTVTVVADVTISQTLEIQKSITLDLNGHTITVDDPEGGTLTYAGLQLLSTGDMINVVLTNGSIVDARGQDMAARGVNCVLIAGAVNVTTSDLTVSSYAPAGLGSPYYNYIVRIQAYGGKEGTLTLDAGTTVNELDNGEEETYGAVGVTIIGQYDKGNDVPENDEGVKLTVKEGVTINTTGYAISGNGLSHGTTINIEGGTLNAKESTGIYHPQYGTLTISGGSITGEVCGVEIRSGNMTVSGGSITGNGVPAESTPNGNGTTTDGAGIAVAQHTTKLPINVTVTGGTIKGYSAIYHSDPQNNSTTNVQLSLTDGTYNAINGGSCSVYSVKFTGFITGGTFSNDVSDYVADGYTCTSSGGQWVVTAESQEPGGDTQPSGRVWIENGYYLDLKWDPIDGADKYYKVYLKADGEDNWKHIISIAGEKTHLLSDFTEGGYYTTVKIEGYGDSDEGDVLVGSYEAPITLNITEVTTSMSITFTWGQPYTYDGITYYPYTIAGLPVGCDECVISLNYTDAENREIYGIVECLGPEENGTVSSIYTADTLKNVTDGEYLILAYDNLEYTQTTASYTVYTGHTLTPLPKIVTTN